MTKLVVALLLALTFTVSAASASGSALRPLQCFRAHGWAVKGTTQRGTAHPRPVTYWRFVRWRAPGIGHRYFVVDSGLKARQLHVVRACLGWAP